MKIIIPMELTKEFIYNNDKIILLACDFYETKQIPEDVFKIKDNIAMFPIVNLPLINYILKNLISQNFKNVILAGKRMKSIIKYLQKTKFFSTMNIRIFNTDGSSLGDIIRGLDQKGFEFKDLIVMYANHYSNIPLQKLLRKHKKSKGNIMTVLVHETNSNDANTHVYAMKNNNLIYYEKTCDGKIESSELLAAFKGSKRMEINTSFSSPTIAVLSSQMFPIFTENFDFQNLGDFIIGVLASPLYNCKIGIFSSDELRKSSDDVNLCQEVVKNFYESPMSSAPTKETLFTSQEPICLYSNEIVTLLDYFKMNSDVAERAYSTFKLQKSPECIKGSLKDSISIFNSFIGEKSHIEGNLKNCIVWDNCQVLDDCEGHIFFSNGMVFNSFYLESVPNSDQTSGSQNDRMSKNDTFFEDFNEYLSSCMYHPKFFDMNLDDILKQINLLRIVWNASRNELIEAFAIFFSEKIDLECLEESVSRSTVFFGILIRYVNTMQDQEFLMNCFYDNLKDMDIDDDLRAQLFFSFAYLFVENGIVHKPVVKKFNKMHKAGIF